MSCDHPHPRREPSGLGQPRRALAGLLLRLGAVLCPVSALGGCCPEVTAVQDSGATSGDGASPVAARLSALQRDLFDAHCVTDCHESVSAAANLRLDGASSYKELVNVASQQLSSQVRVIPGNADDSYLVRKLEGGPGIVGDRMPRLAPPRPQGEIDAVRSWIIRGAGND